MPTGSTALPIWNPPSPLEFSAISDADMACGTSRWLPPMKCIPAAFRRDFALESESRHPYARLIRAIMQHPSSAMLSAVDGVRPRPGYEHHFARQMYRLVHSHMASYTPDQEHKMLGLAYLLHTICTCTALQSH